MTSKTRSLDRPAASFVADFGGFRRQAISLRRYIAPQREVISQLQLAQVTWLTSTHRAKIREVADYFMRYVEDLDAARERMGAMQEELTGTFSEQMNKTMYILTVLAGIFLPMTFVTVFWASMSGDPRV